MKVGDLVKILAMDDYINIDLSLRYRILAVRNSSVDIDINSTFYPTGLSFSHNDLELVKRKILDTELARKMYLEYEIDGEYLWVK